MPKKFTLPNIKPYDDPKDHIAGYKNRMGTCNIPEVDMEAVIYKRFSSTLIGIAQRLYSALPKKSIKSFVVLATKFVNHFSDSRKKEKDMYDIYDLR